MLDKKSELVAFLDEAGDHSLTTIDKDFPVFVLVMLICNIDDYVEKIVPAINRLKFDYWGHEGIILHSREMRKAQGDFGFLTDREKKKEFDSRISDIVIKSEYTLVAVAIRKQNLKAKYAVATSPYELALKYGLERLVLLLEDAGQTQIKIIAESRGKVEDNELERVFYRIITNGTEYIKADRFKEKQIQLLFRSKSKNIVGTQLADLIAYPTARHVLDSKHHSNIYRTFEDKFYKKGGKKIGFKIFP